ncbi:helix-turn-helix domain-containing protein, partial [Calorimonas adulescens]|uniref:helix-turn-helix domain-containing protein n=1 Tax=Calorimonas adulescens TaxID=2606906 RepID=UPI0011F0C902
MEQWYTIQNLYSKGYGKKTIARMLGISKNTVKKVLDSSEFPRYKRVREVEKKIDKFTDAIIDMYYN